MKKIIKISIGLLLALVLMVSDPVTCFTGKSQFVTVEAASTPKTTVNKVSLYVGHKTYQIAFKNLSKSAVVTFKSSNSQIAKVSNSGIITPGRVVGNTIITVTMKQNKKTYTSKINVTVSLSNIKFTDKTSKLTVGDTYQFKAVANGINDKLSWSVSDKRIAKIDEKSGILTAVKKGEVDAIVTAGGLSSSCTVVIGDPKLTTASKDIVCDDETIIYIKAVDMLSKEKLNYSIDNSKIVECVWGDWDGDQVALLIKPVAVGSTKVTITSSKTLDKLELNITVKKRSEKRDPAAKELTAKEIYSKAAPAIVKLHITRKDGELISSGFFISSGILITNCHAIDGATDMTVTTNNNKDYKVNKILGYDEKSDIAMLSIDAVTEHLRPYYGDIAVGEKVYAIGSPHVLKSSVSDGIVSANSRNINGVDYVQVTATITEGNCGGPLMNAYGEVVGINTGTSLDGQKLNLAINVYQYKKLNLKNEVTADAFYEANKEKENSSDSEPTQSPSPIITQSPYPITTPSPYPITTPSPYPVTTPAPTPTPIIIPTPTPIITTTPTSTITPTTTPIITPTPYPILTLAPFPDITLPPNLPTPYPIATPTPFPVIILPKTIQCSRCGLNYDPETVIHACYLRGEYCPICEGIEKSAVHIKIN